MSPQVIVLHRVRPLGMYLLGMREPVALAYVSLDATQLPGQVVNDWADDLAVRLRSALGPYLPHLQTSVPVSEPLLQALCILVAGLQEAAGLPVLERARRLSPAAATVAVLALPTLSADAATAALKWLVALACALAGEPAQRHLLPAQVTSLQALLRQLSPTGMNNRNFIRAAHGLGIPCRLLPGGVWQYGWGRHSRLLLSTISDATSAIGVRWAKDKLATSALLRLAGLPVPAHHLVASAEEAQAVAIQLGFPVVVKPADLDQLQGVEAGLQFPAEVQRAYARAAKLSKKILVEKHVAGKDFRLLVFQGELVWAHERIPAGVTGDGKSSIAVLIDVANQDPRRGLQSWSQMRPISLNDEAYELLAAAGMSLVSVPPEGEFVRLRRIANVSNGGTPVGCFERVHPDNARLVEQAAKVLRLDIAGIDLLVPDIAVSWRVSGGGICEVNAQPQLSPTSPHIYAQILRGLVAGDGRVPSCLVLASTSNGLAQRLTDRLQQCGLAAMLAATIPELTSCLLDEACGALVLASDGDALLHGGVPLDRFDILVLDEAVLKSTTLTVLLSLLKPHVSVLVVACNSGEMSADFHALISRFFDKQALHLATSDAAVFALVADLMRRSEKTHAGIACNGAEIK